MLAGVEGNEVLLNIDDGQGGTQTIGLDFELLADARLVLTDELVAEMLRQRKAAGTAPPDLDESAFDAIETEEGEDPEAHAPPPTRH